MRYLVVMLFYRQTLPSVDQVKNCSSQLFDVEKNVWMKLFLVANKWDISWNFKLEVWVTVLQ